MADYQPPPERAEDVFFLPGTPVLSFGTAGCNLTCKFNNNPLRAKPFFSASPSSFAKPILSYGLVQKSQVRSAPPVLRPMQ
jgi:pyruvate-formate lyase-activating enzyme